MKISASDASHALLQAIAEIQADFILSGQTRESFDPLLAKLLELTESEYGFIGEVLHDDAGSPYLKTHALTNIAWNEETRQFYEENAPNGLEFRNLDTLFGHCLKHGEPVLSGEPATDTRRGGLPPGHPPLLKFGGLPIRQGSEMVGMIGLANRPGGYDQELVDYLHPFLATCATLIVGFRTLSRQREQERRTAAIVNTAVDAIITIDERGIIETFNQGAEGMFGYSAGEILGENVSCLMPEPDSSNHDGHLRDYLDTGRSKIIGAGREVKARRRDGSLFPVDLSVSEVELETRRQFVGILRDITDRKAAEAQLLASKQAAEEANQAKSAFMATMSHEIRTPLNAILGMTELLKETELSREQRDYVQTVSISGDSLLQLINGFLDISKVEAGQLRIAAEDFDLRRLVEDTLAVVRGRAEAKNIALECRLPEDMPNTFRGDSHRIRQILLNLLGNAIKFTDRGFVRLDIGHGTPAGKGPLPVFFRITDSGMGIAQDAQSRVFTKFYQVSGGVLGQSSGTGLGLTICRELARLMGGDVVLESSQPGQGSVFCLTLPLPASAKVAPVESHRPPAEIVQQDATASKPIRTGDYRILLAEDNEANRMLTRQMLQGQDCELDFAENGEAAVERARRLDYDLILMDLDMPICDGIAATAAIRAWEADQQRQPVPIIALTAHALEEYRQRAEEAGVTDYLTKPVRRDSLLHAVGGHLDPRPHALVVDDNEDSRRLTAKMLERTRALRVQTAASGPQALDLLVRRPHAVVVLDLEMPVMGGIETVGHIRRRHGRSLPVIALSGHVGAEHVQRSREAGFDAYLSKPVDRRALADTVMELLSRTEATPDSGPAAAEAGEP